MSKRRPSVAEALDILPGRSMSRAAAWLWISQQADDTGRAGISSRKLAKQFGWTRAKTRRFLASLEECGLIIRMERKSGPSDAVATICAGNDFPAAHEKSGPSQPEPKAQVAAIRAPTAPDKRLVFYAKMIMGPEPIPEGAISPIMAQALIAAGVVTSEAMRRKGVAA